MKLDEETAAGDVATPPVGTPDGSLSGKPYFNVKDDTFWSLHLKKRKERQWYKTYYKDESVCKWCQKNPNKSFYIRHDETGIFRKITP